MPYSHYLQGIDSSFFENEKVTNYNYYETLVNLYVMFSNSKVFFNDKEYYLGQFSEAAFNFYVDGYLEKTKPSFNSLKRTLDQLFSNNYKYTNDNLIKLQETILFINKYIKYLIIFDEKIKKPLDFVVISQVNPTNNNAIKAS